MAAGRSWPRGGLVQIPPGTVPVMTPDLVAVTKKELCSVSIQQPCKARGAELQTAMIHMEWKTENSVTESRHWPAAQLFFTSGGQTVEITSSISCWDVELCNYSCSAPIAVGQAHSGHSRTVLLPTVIMDSVGGNMAQISSPGLGSGGFYPGTERWVF